MPPPIQKPSERLKKKPDEDGFKPDENPLEILRKKVFWWVNTRLGWGLGVVLLAAITLWIKWDAIEKLPGVSWVLTTVAELRSRPRAQGDKFSILVAKLEYDKDDKHRQLIRDALLGRFNKDEVEVLRPVRSITIGGSDKPQEAVKAGHERACGLISGYPALGAAFVHRHG